MGSSASLVSANATLKTLYSSQDLVDATCKGLPLWEMIKKADDYDGDGNFNTAPHQVGSQSGVSADFASANNNTTANVYKRFQIPGGKVYGVGHIEADLVRMSRKNPTSYVRGLEAEQRGLNRRVQNVVSALLWGNGGGAIGQIKAASAVNTTTLTLQSKAAFRFFNIGAKLVVSADDGADAGDTLRAGSLVVTAVNPRDGTVTCDVALNVGIPAVAAGDYVFLEGTFGQTNPLITGVSGWIPQTDPGATAFMGVNRSVYPHGLAGQRYLDGTGGAIEDVFMDFCAYLNEVGSEPSHIFVHPSKFGALAKALSNRVHVDDKSEASIGYKRIKVVSPTGTVEVLGDPGCPVTGLYALNVETWVFHHNGELFGMIEDGDGNVLMYEGTNGHDRYQWQILAFGLLECQEPMHQGFALL